jgi:hypothetical protein
MTEAILPPAKPWPDADILSGIKGQPEINKFGHRQYRFADIPHEVIVPVGLELFHGTSSKDEFSIPRGPASFSLDTKTAQGYADNEGEGVHPRILRYITTKPARCLDHPGVGRAGDTAGFWLNRWADENLGKGYTKEWDMIGYSRVPDKLKIIQEAGYDGIVVRRLDDGGTEVCLFEPENFVRPVQNGSQGDSRQVSELASSPMSSPGPLQMRGSNSSAWAGGRLVLSKPEQHVPEDENESERDNALDQDIVGGGLDWGVSHRRGGSY